MRILLIENDPGRKMFMQSALQNEGYTVEVSHSGYDGAFMAEHYRFDTIVLSSTIETIRCRDLRSLVTTPILVLQNQDNALERARALNNGADDCLVCPFEMCELLARVNALIRRSAGNPKPKINFGDYVVDFVKKKVTHRNEVIQVTPPEYGLIEYLAIHKGKVISRNELYEHLFDDRDRSFSNRLDVLISRIRSKMGKNCITTHRGFGYSIC